MEPIKFVNIANFGTSIDAHMARNELAAAGIPAQVTGDVAVETLWYVGTALGGVKLMVAEKDVPAAVQVLSELGILDSDHALPDDDQVSAAKKSTKGSTAADEWEALANRAWRAAIIGLFLCPPLLHFYSFCLLVFNPDVFRRVEPEHRWKLWAALAIDILVIGLVGTFFWSMNLLK